MARKIGHKGSKSSISIHIEGVDPGEPLICGRDYKLAVEASRLPPLSKKEVLNNRRIWIRFMPPIDYPYPSEIKISGNLLKRLYRDGLFTDEIIFRCNTPQVIDIRAAFQRNPNPDPNNSDTGWRNHAYAELKGVEFIPPASHRAVQNAIWRATRNASGISYGNI